MKVYAFVILLALSIHGCQYKFPAEIENYINNHYSLVNNDTCYINLKDIIIDYDKMYCFKSATSIDEVRDIIHISDYKKNKKMILGNIEEEYLYIILTKNGNIVYENEYNYNLYKTKFVYSELAPVYANKYQEECAIQYNAYETSDTMFMVNCINDEYYIRPCGQNHCLGR